ncbi:MAG: hypothetical protein ABJB47_01385 [Actinomycetota bacterium]
MTADGQDCRGYLLGFRHLTFYARALGYEESAAHFRKLLPPGR